MNLTAVISIVVAIIVGAAGIITAVIKAAWMLATIIGDLKISVTTANSKADETSKDVTSLTAKVDSVQIMVTSLQARTIRLEEKVDKQSAS